MDCVPHWRRTGSCGCQPRRFLSSKEEVELLEDYKNQLRREIAGVEERIRELKKRG